ncbi:MAG: DUF3035 domain-containing protein [Aliidongia sp.]
MTRTVILGSALLVAMSALGGCSDLSKALGLVKAPPDEFAVVAGAPLSLPPDYGLRPPRSTSDKPLGESQTDKARKAVFRVPDAASGSTAAVDPASPLSPGEQSLLGKVGALDVDPGVRARVDKESKQALDQDKGFVDSLMFWKSNPIPGAALDASKEAERLNQAGGAGNAVQIDRTQHSDLEDKL